MAPELEIGSFDPATASEEEFAALGAFDSVLRREMRPEYPELTVDETRAERLHPPASTDVLEWHARRPGDAAIVATAGIYLRNAGDNPHAAWFWVSVLPELRRQGIARELLRVVADACRASGRRLLIAWTSATCPAGEAFMQRLGSEIGQQISHNQLLLADVDRALMRRWIDASSDLLEEFELVWRIGPYPENELEAIAGAQNIMNDAPHGNLDWEDVPTSVEDVRSWDASLAPSGQERWVLQARRRISGEIVGFTMVHYRPAHADLVSQGDTAVAPAYRNRGIGRWLKASMIEKVIEERPLAARVRTGNDTANAAMLKINEEMGFRLYRSSSNWQVPLDKVYAYLDGVAQEAR
jgi:GNAT superfamily N-acetyltransferase